MSTSPVPHRPSGRNSTVKPSSLSPNRRTTERSGTILVQPGSLNKATKKSGGIVVSRQEIQSAFSFLDVDKTGKVTLAQLKVLEYSPIF